MPGVLTWTTRILESVGKLVPNIRNAPGEEQEKQNFKEMLQDMVKLLRNYQIVFKDRAFGRGIALEHDEKKRGSLGYLFVHSHNLSRDVLFEQTYRDEEKEKMYRTWEELIDTPKRKDLEE